MSSLWWVGVLSVPLAKASCSKSPSLLWRDTLLSPLLQVSQVLAVTAQFPSLNPMTFPGPARGHHFREANTWFLPGKCHYPSLLSTSLSPEVSWTPVVPGEGWVASLPGTWKRRDKQCGQGSLLHGTNHSVDLQKILRAL